MVYRILGARGAARMGSQASFFCLRGGVFVSILRCCWVGEWTDYTVGVVELIDAV